MALSDLFGIDSTAGTDAITQALNSIRQALPTGQQLTLPMLQQYVAAGKLTPAQYQATAADPNTYKDALTGAQDNTGMNAQKAALQQLGGIVQAGGSTPINQAN